MIFAPWAHAVRAMPAPGAVVRLELPSLAFGNVISKFVIWHLEFGFPSLVCGICKRFAEAMWVHYSSYCECVLIGRPMFHTYPTQSREQGAHSRKQRAESIEQRGESRKQRAETREERVDSRELTDAPRAAHAQQGSPREGRRQFLPFDLDRRGADDIHADEACEAELRHYREHANDEWQRLGDGHHAKV